MRMFKLIPPLLILTICSMKRPAIYVPFARNVNCYLACRVGIILASECSVFSSKKLCLPALILMTAEGWGKKEIFTKGEVDSKK